MPGIQWADVSVDTLFSRDPGYFHGCVITTTQAGGSVKFFNGTDSTTGQLILRAQGTSKVSNRILFPAPLYCARGLLICDFDHVDNCLVLWEPVAES